MKQLKLMKTLLVAVGLCMGASAWGADKEVTLNCTNSITIVGTTEYGSDGSKYSNLIRLNSYAGQGGAGAVAFTLDGDWDASKVKSAVLQLYVVSKPNKNRSGDINIKSIDSYPNLSANTNTPYSDGKHIVYSETSSSSKRYQFSGTTQATVSASAYTLSAPAQGAYFNVDVTSYMQGLTTKSVGDLVYFGIDISDWAFDTQLGAYGYTSAPKLVVTYSSETLYNAIFTANSGAITPKITIYSDAGRTSSVTNGTLIDNTTYYYRAVLAGYDNYEGSFTVNGANPSVSFTMTAKTRYTFTVNAVNSVGGAVIKTIYTDADSYEGKTHNIVYPKYFTGDNNIVTYSKDDDTYGESKTAQAKNETYTVSYTAYDGVAYFVEVEDVVSSTDYSSWYCSNGAAVRGFKDIAKNIFTIPATGVYDVTYAACNNNVNYDMAVTLSKNETEIATKSDFKSISINYIKTTGIVKNSNISLAKDDVLKLTPSTTNAIIDYMLIELKSVPATITSSTGYATFSSTYALDFSEVTGLTAYTATACDGTNVTLTPVSGGTVAANTGLVIKGETTDIPVVATGDAQAGNLMHPCDGSWTTLSKSDTGTNYVLSEQGTPKVAVFAPIGDTSATLRAGSAYLYVPTSGARTLNIVFDEDATGIASVKSEFNAVNGYYNLAGQRIAQPTKGLYIVNGKKVVIK